MKYRIAIRAVILGHTTIIIINISFEVYEMWQRGEYELKHFLPPDLRRLHDCAPAHAQLSVDSVPTLGQHVDVTA